LVEPAFNSGWRVVTGFPNKSQQFDADKDMVKCLYRPPPKATEAFDFWIIDGMEKNLYGVRNGKYSDLELSWSLPLRLLRSSF
jgi:hypothetical protein